MIFSYSSTYFPPAPILHIRLATPGESAKIGPISAIIDTGSDGTLIPSRYLENVEAIGVGDALLHGILGEVYEAHLFKVDIWIDSLIIPGVTVVAIDRGEEVILGRNIVNKLILLLDGHRGETELFEQRPKLR